MPNIFDGFYKMDEERLTYLIATLEVVTVKNILSEAGQKTKKGSINVTNKVFGRFLDTKIKETEVISIDKRIKNQAVALSVYDYEQLQNRLRQVLINKVNSTNMSLSNVPNPSDDRISVEVIDIACKAYKKDIPDEFTYSQKADAIRHRYNEKLLAQTQKILNNQSEEEKRATAEEIQEQIDNFSQLERDELKEALGVEQLTGETVRKMLTTSGGTTAALMVLELSGFGAYMALTTIMHAVFTTTLGITLPFAAYTGATSALAFITGPFGWIALIGTNLLLVNRNKNKLIEELLAQTVWSSVESYGKKFTPEEEALPSWLPDSERDAAKRAEKEYQELLSENAKLKKELSNSKQKAVSLSSDLIVAEGKYYELKDIISNYPQQKQKYEEQIGKLEIAVKEIELQLKNARAKQTSTDDETVKKYENDRERFLRTIETLNRDNRKEEEEYLEALIKIDEQENEIKNIKKENNDLKQKNKELEIKTLASEEKLNRIEERDSKELEQRWTKAYQNIEFKNTVFKEVSKNFEKNDYGYIERNLGELNAAKDPAALASNRGKMSDGTLHTGFSTSTGFPSRVFYDVIKNSTKKVYVNRIKKHNDSTYGKEYRK